MQRSQIAKDVYDLGVSTLVTLTKVPVKGITAAYYGPVNDLAIDLAAQKVVEVAKVGTDAVANAAYATPSSIGSKVAQWYGYPG